MLQNSRERGSFRDLVPRAAVALEEAERVAEVAVDRVHRQGDGLVPDEPRGERVDLGVGPKGAGRRRDVDVGHAPALVDAVRREVGADSVRDAVAVPRERVAVREVEGRRVRIVEDARERRPLERVRRRRHRRRRREDLVDVRRRDAPDARVPERGALAAVLDERRVADRALYFFRERRRHERVWPARRRHDVPVRRADGFRDVARARDIARAVGVRGEELLGVGAVARRVPAPGRRGNLFLSP